MTARTQLTVIGLLLLMILCVAFLFLTFLAQDWSDRAQAWQASRASTVPSPVYLIPMGDLREPDLAEMAALYSAKYQIPVEVLSPVALPDSALDVTRGQLIAESLMAQMKQSYASKTWGTGAILIGVTAQSMYRQARSQSIGSFAFRERGATVISTYFMDPRHHPGPYGPDLLNTRLRKVITASIAVNYYGMRTTHDPNSVLFDSLDSVAALDAASEDPDPILNR